MNYTEEEFFGNNQNKVIDEETVEPITEKDGNEKKEFDLGSTVLFTFLKTLAVLVCTAFYCIAVTITLMPRTAIKLFDMFGANGASLVCYERIYKTSNSLADLYNVVQQSIRAKDYKKTAEYIEELKGKNGYQEFCQKVNTASVQSSENKYIAYVGDLDSYLVSQKILALYNAGQKDAAEDYAIKDLIDADNIYSFGFATLVECVFKDNQLTETQQTQKFIEIYTQTIQTDLEVKDVVTYIDEQRDLADLSNAQSDDLVDKILRVYTCLKIENVKLKYYEVIEDEVSADNVRAEIEELQEEYNRIIN